MVGELAAQVVVEVPDRQAREEVPRQLGKPLFAREPAHGQLDVLRRRTEETRQVRPGDRGQAFRSCKLRHFAEVGASSRAPDMVIDRLGKAAHQSHERRRGLDVDSKRSEMRGKILRACRERDLCQKPERMDKGRIAGSSRKATLGGGSSCRRDRLELSALAEQLDDLIPFLGGRNPT